MRSPLLTKLENFWYHYKWHTIVALFLIFTVTISSLQMCSKEEIDVYVMYAGHKVVERTSDDDIPEYNTIVSSLNKHADDYDGNGKTTISFSTLYYLSGKELESMEDVNTYLLQSDSETLMDRMYFGEYYLCFISQAVYEKYHVQGDSRLFLPLAEYAPEGNSFVYYGSDAIKLSSLPFYQMPGIEKLPDDTLLCLRKKSAITNGLSGSRTDELFSRSEDMLRSILAYGN